MIYEIQARTLLSSVRQPDRLFGLRYNLNLYRGCQHRCIYCDSRSQCYGIENFDRDVLVKVNALELLERELPRKRVKGTIGTGSMNDPYMPLEKQRRLTAGALGLIARYGFPVHILTKSSLVLRDLDLLQEIARVYAAVSLTITTADDELGRRLEPGAALVSERFRTIEKLAAAGTYSGVTLMPVLPFLEDDPANIQAIVERAADAGAAYILPGFAVTLRDRQRAYFYEQLDRRFPGLRGQYERAYGERYGCAPLNSRQLQRVFREACERRGIATRMRVYAPAQAQQMTLF